MSSLGSDIESQDWFATLPPTPNLRLYVKHLGLIGPDIYRDEIFDFIVLRALDDFGDAAAAGEDDEAVRATDSYRSQGRKEYTPAIRVFLAAFRRELHELLCSNDKESEERRNSILKESNVGQSSLALTIAAMIAPALGTSAGMIAGAVTVALAVIGRVGLQAWCSTQSR